MNLKKPAVIFLLTKAYTWITLIILIALTREDSQAFIHIFFHKIINWDAIWFLKISMQDYDVPRKFAFFPLMPLYTRIFAPLFKDYAISGLVLSNFFSFMSITALYMMVKKEYGEKAAVITAVLFAVNPVSIFFTTIYSESLFMFLTLLFFLLLKDKNWFFSALAGMLASLTRNTGVLLVLPLLFVYFTENNKKIDIKAVLYSLITAAGLLSYMAFMYLKAGNAFLFTEVQGRGLSWPFHNLVSRLSHINMYFEFRVYDYRSGISFLYYVLALIFLIYSFRRIKGAYFIYFAAFMALMAVLESPAGMSRYISSCFPAWIALGVYVSRNRHSRFMFACIVALSLAWQAYINFRWIMGWWVA